MYEPPSSPHESTINTRQILLMALISLIVVGGYWGYDAFFNKKEDVTSTTPAVDAPEVASAPADESFTPEPELNDSQPSSAKPVPVEPTPVETAPTTPAQVAATKGVEPTSTPLKGNGFRALVSNVSGGFEAWHLHADRMVDGDGNPLNLVTTDRPEYNPGRLHVQGIGMPENAVWQVTQKSESLVELRWTNGRYTVVRELEAATNRFQAWSTVRVTNHTTRPRKIKLRTGTHHYTKTADEGGGMLARRSPKITTGLCLHDDEVTRMDKEKVRVTPEAPKGHGYGGKVGFVGIEDSFFTILLAPEKEAPGARCQIVGEPRGGTVDEPHGNLFAAGLVSPVTEIPPGETHMSRSLIYAGPKSAADLEAAGHELSRAIDLGWFSAVAQQLVRLLTWVYGFAGNWGLAIILMTILVRLVMFPLTWKSFQSMARMRVVKPEIDRINALYADDREKKGAAMMEIYRKHKINPIGGCLPQVVQMPVWFAFYASLSTNVELYHANFVLWWTDLSAPDPYYVLPLTLGALMFLQQRLTPTTMDASQAKIMMYMMPIMITVFMLFLPAGLCLYMVTSSMLGLAQQQTIHRALDRKTAAEKSAQKAPQKNGDKPTESGETPEAVLGTPALAGGNYNTDDRSSSVVERTTLAKKNKKNTKRRTRRGRQ